MSGTGEAYPGWVGVSTANDEYGATWLVVRQILSTVRTATIVQVQACTNSGGVSAVGSVDVLPLVNMVDGKFQATPHSTIYGLPYSRIQGGTNAIICDPAVGDIGIAVFADRDISAVKATKAQASPGSRRRFSFSDGVYLFGILNGVPTQYVQFTSTGIDITDMSGNMIAMGSAGITINGVLFDRSQNVTNVNDITLSDSVDLKNHVHGGVQTGSSNTTGPTG